MCKPGVGWAQIIELGPYFLFDDKLVPQDAPVRLVFRSLPSFLMISMNDISTRYLSERADCSVIRGLIRRDTCVLQDSSMSRCAKCNFRVESGLQVLDLYSGCADLYKILV